MKTILCIPTYNERENIDLLIPIILRIFDNHGIKGRILVIDDNSPDGTADVVRRWIEKDSRVKLLNQSRKMGLGSAYRAGFRRALELEPEAIFEMDADFSHDPKMIPIMLQSLKTADLVVGSRKVGKGEDI
ncbi:MAG: glycosyltransferase [Candidatus Hodarchaeota archaeon]